MTSRFTLSDTRWFTDYRPICVIENEYKEKLHATSQVSYKNLLQKNAEKIMETNRITPSVTLTGVDGKKIQYCMGCNHV